MRFRRIGIVISALLMLLAAPDQGQAQENFPSRPIPPTPRRFGTAVLMVPSAAIRKTPPPSTSLNNNAPSVSTVGPSASPYPDARISNCT